MELTSQSVYILSWGVFECDFGGTTRGAKIHQSSYCCYAGTIIAPFVYSYASASSPWSLQVAFVERMSAHVTLHAGRWIVKMDNLLMTDADLVASQAEARRRNRGEGG